MSDPHAPSKPREAPLHRSDIAGAIAWAAVAAFLMAIVVSPGGDPYSVVFYTTMLFPAALFMYWLGFRHGRIAGRNAIPNETSFSTFTASSPKEQS